MPKKFKGENSKAAEAKAKKDAVKNAADEQKKKAVDDAYWADDDKHIAKKQQRKDDKEKKHQEAMRRKQEAQDLLEQENSGMKPAKPAEKKLTRAQIAENKVIVEAEVAAAAKKEETPVNELPLEENLNRLQIEGEARDVEEALHVLNNKPTAAGDQHPEKRVKAAFAAFETRRLAELKTENPNLRLSQLKQMLKKEWQKSPENPMNER